MEQTQLIQNVTQNTKQMPLEFVALKKQINDDGDNLFSQLKDIFFSDFNQEQKEAIIGLIESWDLAMDLESILSDEDITNSSYFGYYKHVEILSARVYQSAIKFFTDIRIRTIKQVEGKSVEGLRQILQKQELIFSYNRHFFDRRYIKNSGVNYNNVDFKPTSMESHLNSKFINEIYIWINNSEISLLKNIFQFLLDIELVKLEDSKSENKFLANLERISREEQQKKYLSQVKLQSFEAIGRLSSKKFQFEGQEQQIKQESVKTYPSYHLYKNFKRQGKLCIEVLQSKYGDYSFFDQKDDVLVEMFPNLFGYVVKSKAESLTYIEKHLFLNDLEAGFNLLFSIHMFFDYLGIRLDIKSTDCKLKVYSSIRVKATLLANTKNSQRIMRVLASISVLGFRKIALNFIQLLDDITSQGQILEKQRSLFERSWEIYGNDNQKAKVLAKQMCFLQTEEFPEGHKILALCQKIWGDKEIIENK